MENFEQKLKKYTDFLTENAEIVGILISSNANDKKKIRQILEPKTERELMASEILISFTSDFKNLMKAILNDEVENISLEENVVLDLYAETLMAVKEGKDISINNIFDIATPKELAKFYFDFMTSFLTDPERTLDCLYKKVGVDFDNEEEIAEINRYIEKTNAIMNFQNESKTLDDYSDEEINKTAELAKEFHILCEQHIIGDEPKRRVHKKSRRF